VLNNETEKCAMNRSTNQGRSNFLPLEKAYGRICSPKHPLTFQMVTDVASTAVVVLQIFNWRPRIKVESLK